jgi:cyclopropane fatty-acyl-phospholipid synthase-like methyltransferase
MKPFAAASERNKHAILGVLREEFRDLETVLEIGSGTGQHAVFLADELAYLDWQTSDVQANHDGIQAWIRESGVNNVRDPLSLDVRDTALPESRYDAVFSANTAHIMGEDAVACMFAIAADILVDRGVFALYGPFSIAGQFNSASNEQFDASLRQQDPGMGIRDLDNLDALAGNGGLWRQRLYAMPANNYMAVWSKRPGVQK